MQLIAELEVGRTVRLVGQAEDEKVAKLRKATHGNR
jgi:hypothetical protein